MATQPEQPFGSQQTQAKKNVPRAHLEAPLPTLPGGEVTLARAPWTPYATMLLAAWLLSSPAVFGERSAGMVWSDILSGALLLVFSLFSLSPRHAWARWANGFVGLWLLFAPLIFWAQAAAYTNDTLIGCLVIAFALLIPGVPGEDRFPGPEVPPGWSYNPSAWTQRAPIVALAFLSFFLSRYLAAYQLGHIPKVWDPFFGDGTRRVLESEVSRAFPVSDAGLGAVSYLVEGISGLLGGTRRWRSMPWLVLLFGVLVIPLGVVSIVLVTLQPVAVGAWCSLCLMTAVLMLLMLSPALDEVIATLQFLQRSVREGKPFWRTFWQGGPLEIGAELPPARRPLLEEILSAAELLRVPWNMVLCAALGLWLMAAPALLGVQGAIATQHYIVGPLVVTCSVMAIGEVARPVRLLNLLFGGWFILAPWLLPGASTALLWSDMLVGLLLIVASIPRGEIHERYGGWEHYAAWPQSRKVLPKSHKLVTNQTPRGKKGEAR
jgi:uncharacterized membrane protein